MPEVNRLLGKHLFPSVGSNAWFAEILTLSLLYFIFTLIRSSLKWKSLCSAEVNRMNHGFDNRIRFIKSEFEFHLRFDCFYKMDGFVFLRVVCTAVSSGFAESFALLKFR